jgi:hypothetical protein
MEQSRIRDRREDLEEFAPYLLLLALVIGPKTVLKRICLTHFVRVGAAENCKLSGKNFITESIFLKRMTERYGWPRDGSAAATAIKNAENVLSYVFARVYFPTFSYRLKGSRQISRFPLVGFARIRARSDCLATSLGGFK